MSETTISTKDLAGLRVIDGGAKEKRIGKVHHFVFHPMSKRVLGFTVKRPDAALMFHRKDLFVGLSGFYLSDGQVKLRDDAKTVDAAAHRALDVAWEACVLWVGMPAVTEEDEMLGYVSSVDFDAATGAVRSIALEAGMTKDALLGRRVIPAKMVRGFKLGMGVPLAPVGSYDGSEADDDAVLGAIVVSAEAAQLASEGGAAEVAGKATAVAVNKVKTEAGKAKVAASKTVGKTVEQAKPIARQAARKTEEAVGKGAFVAGRQLGRATGMFSAFKEEFRKGLNDPDEED